MNTALVVPTFLPSPASSAELVKPCLSIQDDVRLQELITESHTIGVELENHLPITCIQTPLGDFVDPREVYLQVAAQQKQSRELVVSEVALKLLEKYTENVMARVIRLSEFLQERGICPRGDFERTFSSRGGQEEIEVSFRPRENFLGYCFRITTNSREASKLMFNIAFMKYPKVEPFFSQGFFAGSEQDIQRGNEEYITLQLDKGSMFLDSQVRDIVKNRRKIVAGKIPDDVEDVTSCLESPTPRAIANQVLLLT